MSAVKTIRKIEEMPAAEIAKMIEELESEVALYKNSCEAEGAVAELAQQRADHLSGVVKGLEQHLKSAGEQVENLEHSLTVERERADEHVAGCKAAELIVESFEPIIELAKSASTQLNHYGCCTSTSIWYGKQFEEKLALFEESKKKIRSLARQSGVYGVWFDPGHAVDFDLPYSYAMLEVFETNGNHTFMMLGRYDKLKKEWVQPSGWNCDIEQDAIHKVLFIPPMSEFHG